MPSAAEARRSQGLHCAVAAGAVFTHTKSGRWLNHLPLLYGGENLLDVNFFDGAVGGLEDVDALDGGG